MSRLNGAVVQELVKTVDLQEYMRGHMELRRSGDHYSARCPFHNDSTPSFHVWADHFHCYGCGKHGDVIEYERFRSGSSFRDAVVSLAERFNFPVLIADEQDEKTAALLSEKRRCVELIEAVGEYYHQFLFSEKGEEARKYLASRGFGDALCQVWRLGLAPSFGVLEELSRKNGWDLRDLENAGLLATTADKTRKYDFFRGRIVFPIRNDRGQTIGFGGRVYKIEDVSRKEIPKFINPRETVIYSKSRVLFNYDRARAAIVGSGDVVVVEGYMDALSLASAGIENVVAVAGTAMTPEHVKLLSKSARRAFLCFDSDSAGQKAAERAFEVAYPMNLLELLFLRVSDGKDPDEFVRKHGAQSFRELMGSATPLIEQVTNWAKTGEQGSREAWIRSVRKRVLPVLEKNPDAAQREVALSGVARVLGLSSVAVLAGLPRLGHALDGGTGEVSHYVARSSSQVVLANDPSSEDALNLIRWRVGGTVEIKLVVALLCLPVIRDGGDMSALEGTFFADGLVEDASKMEIMASDTVELVSYICKLLREKCVEISPCDLPFSEFLKGPPALQALVALMKGDFGYLEEFGLKAWPRPSSKERISLNSSKDVLTLQNASYINFCIQDVQMSLKRGSLLQYLTHIMAEIRQKCQRAKLLGKLS